MISAEARALPRVLEPRLVMHLLTGLCVQMPWQGPFWGLSSTESWASNMKKNQDSTVVMWCHQILQHLEALLRLVCLTGGSVAGTASQFPSPILSEVCFVAKCATNKSFITGPWDKDGSFTDSHCFCLWFDTNYSFLPYFLPLRQFLNCGIVLCFIFPLLSFLISLLNCAESWNNYDAAESFFQLQKGIEGLRGNEIPPREICADLYLSHSGYMNGEIPNWKYVFLDVCTKVKVWKASPTQRQQN